ncbi:MAG: protease pro-enzyme activation domain-containing protein [Candidatus Sulfotelmatobacter sp.]
MRSWKFLLPLLATSLCFAAQPDRITGGINSGQMVALAKSLHPKAKPEYDQGVVDPSLKLTYITMLMAPSPTQQKALDQLLAQQQNPKSPNYHEWLTPQQFADQFGLSQNDLNEVTAWLKSEGFQIISVGGGHNSIAFSGTAAQVQHAFNSEIHRYNVNGEEHIANSTPLMIPTALSGIVSSVMGVHNFGPHPTNRFRGQAGVRNPRPDYYSSGFNTNFLAPGDVATIYDINPLYTASTPIDGAGQKLAIIGQTDVYLADLNDFRSGFGLNPITGCTTNPTTGIITACNSTYFRYNVVGADTGTTYNCGDLGEADLDIEWSGAIARNAQIIFVNSPLTYDSNCNIVSGGGVNAALTTAVDPSSGPVAAPVVSMSYGICELEADSLETVLTQGNAEGVTILNSSDDIGSAGCDFSPPNNTPPFSAAVGGLAVSYPASSPEVTGVGGTEISVADDATPPNAFWGTTNGTNEGSALSYIPEIPWNDDEELAQLCQGDSTNLFCEQGGSPAVTGWVPLTSTATAQQVQEDIWISAGGGGASNCINSPSGICLASGGGFAQPSYQQTLVVPSAPAGVRYVPDVSMMASPNFPGYIFCTPVNAPTTTTSTCASGIATAVDPNQSIIGGTSVSSPVFAGIVTLLNQYLAASGGLSNINSKLYYIAAANFYPAFHHVTTGDNNVYCQAGDPVGFPSNVVCPSSGVIGYSAANSDPATGYNLVNGLGSVDVNQLALAWAASAATTATSLSSSTTTSVGGLGVTLTANLTPTTAAGYVNYYVTGSNSPIGKATVSAGTAALLTTALPNGADNITASYFGNNGGSTSNSVTVTVTPADFSMSASVLTPASVPAGQSTTAVLTITPVTGAGTITFTPSNCSGLLTGATCSFSPAMVQFGGVSPTGTTTLTISTTANMTVPMPPVAQTVTVTGTESGTGGNSHTAAVSFTLAATNQTFSVAPTNGTATYSIAAGATAAVQLTVTGTNGFVNSSSNTTALPVTYSCLQSSIPSEASCAFSPNGGSAVSGTSLTLNISTGAPSSQLHPPLGRGSRIFYALLLPGLFGIVFGARSRNRGVRLLGLIVVLGLSTLGLGSCGSSNSSTGGQKNPGTPAGSYTIVVNATTAGPTALTATPLKITLNVTN